jgi:hypothetical protein
VAAGYAPPSSIRAIRSIERSAALPSCFYITTKTTLLPEGQSVLEKSTFDQLRFSVLMLVSNTTKQDLSEPYFVTGEMLQYNCEPPDNPMDIDSSDGKLRTD